MSPGSVDCATCPPNCFAMPGTERACTGGAGKGGPTLMGLCEKYPCQSLAKRRRQDLDPGLPLHSCLSTLARSTALQREQKYVPALLSDHRMWERTARALHGHNTLVQKTLGKPRPHNCPRIFESHAQAKAKEVIFHCFLLCFSQPGRAPRWPKMPPRWPQDGPRWPQDGPSWHQYAT